MKTIDEKTFNDICKSWYSRLIGYVYGRIKDRSTAEDLAQITFLKLYKTDFSKITNEQHLEKWLLRVCKNEMIKYLQKRNRLILRTEISRDLNDFPEEVVCSRLPELHDLDFLEDISRERSTTISASDFLENIEKRNIAVRLLSKLTGRTATIMNLYSQGISNAEIASKLGMSQTMVNYTVCVTKAKLRDQFKKNYECS